MEVERRGPNQRRDRYGRGLLQRRICELVKRLAVQGPVAVTITGGEESTRTRTGFHAPKRELMVSLQMAITKNELVIPAGLRLRGALIEEGRR